MLYDRGDQKTCISIWDFFILSAWCGNSLRVYSFTRRQPKHSQVWKKSLANFLFNLQFVHKKKYAEGKRERREKKVIASLYDKRERERE